MFSSECDAGVFDIEVGSEFVDAALLVSEIVLPVADLSVCCLLGT